MESIPLPDMEALCFLQVLSRVLTRRLGQATQISTVRQTTQNLRYRISSKCSNYPKDHTFKHRRNASTEEGGEMDQLVNDIRKHSVEGEYKLLAGKLQSSAEQIGGQDVVTLDSILDSLEPGKHTLGIMAAL